MTLSKGKDFTMLEFGSLFAGIGGIDLGLERAGMTCKWQVEIDPFCQKVLQKHWPNVARYADVRSVGKSNLKPVDLIAGGFPCQPHSFAGKRRGAEDDRNLWPEYRRIIGDLKPTWVIGENVPGIKTTILDEVLSDLEGLEYETRTFVIPACAFDASHIRERVFVIAHTQSIGWGSWRAEPTGQQRQAGSIVDRSRLAHTAGQRFGETGQYSQRSTKWTSSGSASLAHTEIEGLAEWWHRPDENPGEDRQATKPGSDRSSGCSDFAGERRFTHWTIEPGVGRVAHGIPHRVDRLRSLGNAVVPQVMEWIGRQIVESDCFR